MFLGSEVVSHTQHLHELPDDLQTCLSEYSRSLIAIALAVLDKCTTCTWKPLASLVQVRNLDASFIGSHAHSPEAAFGVADALIGATTPACVVVGTAGVEPSREHDVWVGLDIWPA